MKIETNTFKAELLEDGVIVRTNGHWDVDDVLDPLHDVDNEEWNNHISKWKHYNYIIEEDGDDMFWLMGNLQLKDCGWKFKVEYDAEGMTVTVSGVK